MKKSLIILLTAVLFMVVLGCGLLPAKPPSEEGAEAAPSSEEPVAGEVSETPPTSEETEQDMTEQVEEDEEEMTEQEVTEEIKTTDKLQISGSLNLQDNLQLCPHLTDRFECNKYELARCDFKTFVSKNDFYPDTMSCRNGYDYKGENPNHKYCFTQECRPLEEDNIVYAYGGTVAFVEYIYNVEKVEGGIMTRYTLHKCGEEFKEFKTSFDCRVYKSELKNI